MALDKMRSVDLRIDKANDYLVTKLLSKQGDYNGRELIVQITNGGVVENQITTQMNLGWRHLKYGNSGLDPFKLIDADKGLFGISYSEEMLRTGDVLCTVQIIQGGKLTETRNFNLEVEESPINKKLMVTQDSFKALEKALTQVNEWDGKFESKYAGLEEEYALELTTLKQETTAQFQQNETHSVDWLNASKTESFEVAMEDDARTIYVPDSVVDLPSSITLIKNKNLFGNGSLLSFSGQTKGLIVKDTNQFICKDITFNGRNVDDLINITNVKKVIFENCHFEDINRNAVQIRSAHKVRFSNCSFKNVRGNAVSVRDAKHLSFSNCEGLDIGWVDGYNEGSLIYAHNCKYVGISGNTTINNLDSAIYVNQSIDGLVIITHNIVERCHKEAIKNQGNASKTITSGNIINICNGNGIVVHYNSGETLITNNQVHDSCLQTLDGIVNNGSVIAAISINNARELTVTGNLVKRTRFKDSSGIRIQMYAANKNNNAKIIVSDNIIEDTAGLPLYVQESYLTQINGNTIVNGMLDGTAYRYLVHLDRVTGNFNNNVIKQGSFSNGLSTILSDYKVQLPLGFAKNKNLFVGAEIGFYLSDNSNNERYIETIILDYDIETNIITVKDSLLSFGANAIVKFHVTLKHTSLQFILRFYTSVVINTMGNYIEKPTSTDIYRNDDVQGHNVITQLNSFETMNTVNNY